ncbi:hypothetical protein BDB01DRAFT_832715 [Pilobolus umbonatus]|nr:hypothetical protein BDB01DRAFT_832715 [Pilobolus umbonatus]
MVTHLSLFIPFLQYISYSLVSDRVYFIRLSLMLLLLRRLHFYEISTSEIMVAGCDNWVKGINPFQVVFIVFVLLYDFVRGNSCYIIEWIGYLTIAKLVTFVAMKLIMNNDSKRFLTDATPERLSETLVV